LHKDASRCDDKQLPNYVKEPDIIVCVGADHYQHLKDNLTKKSKKYASLMDIKRELVTNVFYAQLLTQIRASRTGAEADTKYFLARDRVQNMDKDECNVVKMAMTRACIRFLGCFATKIPVQIFDELLDTFDDPKYEHIKIIPSTLKHRVFEHTTNEKLKAYLETGVENINLGNNYHQD